MRTSADYVEFFLNCSASVARIECLHITHPSFSREFLVVRNWIGGVTVKHEDGNFYFYEHYPLKIKMKTNTADLDFGVSVSLGDLGDLVPKELERIVADGMQEIKPILTYRSYRSDVLDVVLDGPHRLEIKTVTYNRDGCTFDASPATINNSKTGERYDLTRFYPLRGFLY